MTEILTESFCERCGSRYTFESAVPKDRLRKVKVLSRGLKTFVLDDKTSLDEAMASARSDTDRAVTSSQLDAFHKTFNFCMQCRQYTCPNCWNEAEGRCLTCAPNLSHDILPAPFPDVAAASALGLVAGTNGSAPVAPSLNGSAATNGAATNGAAPMPPDLAAAGTNGRAEDGLYGFDAIARLDALSGYGAATAEPAVEPPVEPLVEAEALEPAAEPTIEPPVADTAAEPTIEPVPDEPVGAAVIAEPVIVADAVEPMVDAVETMVDAVEPMVEAVELELLVDAVEPEPAVASVVAEPMVEAVEPELLVVAVEPEPAVVSEPVEAVEPEPVIVAAAFEPVVEVGAPEPVIAPLDELVFAPDLDGIMPPADGGIEEVVLDLSDAADAEPVPSVAEPALAADDAPPTADHEDTAGRAAAAAATGALLAGLRPGQSLDDAIDAFERDEPTEAATPTDAVEGVVALEPEPEPVAAAEVAPVPEPVIAAEVAPEPELVVATETTPEPVVAAEVAPEPEPVIAAEPEPEPEPVIAAEVAPEPEPEPVAEPAPEPVAAAMPEPIAATVEPESVIAAAAVVAAEPVVTAEPVAPAPATEPEPEPIAASSPVEPEPVVAPAVPAPPADIVPQPTWTVVAPDPTPANGTTPVPPATEPQWPATPEWPAQQASPGLPFLGRPAMPTGGVDALWAASDQAVTAMPTNDRAPTGVQACVSCGLSLSATARFCRRCGTAQHA